MRIRGKHIVEESGQFAQNPASAIEKHAGTLHIITIMLEQNTKRAASGTAAPSRRWRLIVLLLVTPLILIGGAALGCHALNRLWFTDNRHLVLRHVSVSSSGYWSGRGDELAARLHLQPGTAMFRIDPAEVRTKLEKIPCIAKARVYRELPDTLRIELTERVPRAIVGMRNSPFVIDEDGMLMLRRESMASEKMELPVIAKIPLKDCHLGKLLPSAAPALKLIMLMLHDFPSYNVESVEVIDDSSMNCYLYYRGDKSVCYRVIVPAKHPDMAMLLRALEAAIIDVKRNGSRQYNFNLTYDGQVVIK